VPPGGGAIWRTAFFCVQRFRETGTIESDQIGGYKP
jgi:hypothetical protein